MNKIFLRFTIKGDGLSAFDMLNDISVKADVYGLVFDILLLIKCFSD